MSDTMGIREFIRKANASRAQELASRWGKRSTLEDFPCANSDDTLRCKEHCWDEQTCEYASIYRELLSRKDHDG